MTSKTFSSGTVIDSAWLNDTNTIVYTTVPSHTTQIAAKAAAGTNTDITSLNSPALGSATATTQIIGDSSTKVATTAFVQQAIPAAAPQIQSLSASVASNALTISTSSLSLTFRNSSLTNGTASTVTGTPTPLVISSGSTLGTINGQQSVIVVLALNNAGTIELAAVNLAGGVDLSETGLISTTAEGGSGGADSATVVYSTTARSSLPYRVIGYIESTQATAGTWATSPSKLQGAGGNAVTAFSSIGYGQTWQTVTRTTGVTYYNLTGKPILTIGQIPQSTDSFVDGYLTISGLQVANYGYGRSGLGSNGRGTVSGIVPPGASYVFSGSVTSVVELR